MKINDLIVVRRGDHRALDPGRPGPGHEPGRPGGEVMDPSKMNTDQLAMMAMHDRHSEVRADAVNELARRLEAAEAKAATYWAECEAWRFRRKAKFMLEIDSAEKEVRRRVRATNAMNAAREVRSE